MKTAQPRAEVQVENASYTVCRVNQNSHDAFLTVPSKRARHGVMLACEHPQFDDYLAAFQEDDAPAIISPLCRALLLLRA